MRAMVKHDKSRKRRVWSVTKHVKVRFLQRQCGFVSMAECEAVLARHGYLVTKWILDLLKKAVWVQPPLWRKMSPESELLVSGECIFLVKHRQKHTAVVTVFEREFYFERERKRMREDQLFLARSR